MPPLRAAFKACLQPGRPPDRALLPVSESPVCRLPQRGMPKSRGEPVRAPRAARATGFPLPENRGTYGTVQPVRHRTGISRRVALGRPRHGTAGSRPPGDPAALGKHSGRAARGARLGDYHAFRNARLLHPDIPNRDQPVSVHTGVMEVRSEWDRWRRHSGPLPVIVTVVSVGGTAYVLAAHPCFLPKAFCPDHAALEADGGRPAVGRKNVIRWHFRAPTTGDLTAA